MASEEACCQVVGAGQLALSDQELFSFQDDLYHSEFKQRLQCMREQGMLTDVTLKAGKVSVKCHKVALAAASKYFYQLFNTEDPPNVVHLEGIVEKVLEPMVDFVYLASVEIKADLVKDLSRSCDELQLVNLKKGCDEFIAERVVPANAMGLYMFAKEHQLEATLKTTQKCLNEKPEEVQRLALNPEYQELSEEALISWISSDHLKVRSEDVVFKIVENWIGATESRSREEVIAKVLAHVRLPYCTPEFLVKYVRKSTLVRYNSCREFVDEAFNFCHLESKGIDTTDVENERTRPRKGINGQYVLLGGVSDGVANSQVWAMDEDTQQWKEISVLPKEIQKYPFHTRACAVADGIILTGGSTDEGINRTTQTAWFFDMATNKWIELPKMSQARAGHGMLAVENEVYVFGGKQGNGRGSYLDSVEKLDKARQNWSAVAPMPIAIDHAQAFLFGSGDIYVISCNHTKILKYSTGLNTWYIVPATPSSNWPSAAISMRENIYILGGRSDYRGAKYNTKTDMCSTLAQHKQNGERYYCSIFQHKDKLVICGGATGDSMKLCKYTSSEYDPQSDSWSNSTFRLPKPLACHTVVTFNMLK